MPALSTPRAHWASLSDHLLPPSPCASLAAESIRRDLGRYYQSPVDRSSGVTTGSFRFTEVASLDLSTSKSAAECLAHWTKSDRSLVYDWIAGAAAPNDRLEASITGALNRIGLRNEALYGRRVCRLVHRRQLRFDPHYHVVYQLTPGQMRLIGEEPTSSRDSSLDATLIQVREAQRLYWGMSELAQSAVAMFDSDLGRGYHPGERQDQTHQFLELAARGMAKSTPADVNRSSPLRFWAPPAIFVNSVFHLLLWRAILTGRDLYHRAVISGDPAETLDQRCEQYYVAVNRFNAAKYRIADYAGIVRILTAIARRLKQISPRTFLDKISTSTIAFPNSARTACLYNQHLPRSKDRFGALQGLRFELASSLRQKPAAFLLRSGGFSDGPPATVSDLLSFLRDRTLETLLWAAFQMEIRSIGMVPVQQLYAVRIRDEARSMLNTLRGVVEAAAAPTATAELRLGALKSLRNHVETKAVDNWCEIKEVYGGPARRIFDDSLWRVNNLGGIAPVRVPGNE